MKHVEFRFLQAIVSHATNDHVTLALVHWDGQQIRTAYSFAHLKFCDPEQRDIIKRTVKAKLRRAKGSLRRRDRRSGQGSLLPLAALFPVREGVGASLYWSPVQQGVTHDPAAHFEEVAVQARIREPAPREVATVTNRDLSNQLLVEVGRMAEGSPDRVRLSHKVGNRQQTTVPVSWKNGRWHHALPLSFDGLDQMSMAKRVRELVGLVQLCIPDDDVPVPVVVYPESPTLAQAAQEQAEIAQEALADRGVSVVTAERSDHHVLLSALLERIRADIRV